MGDEATVREDSTGSTGQKDGEGDGLPRPSVSGQSEHVLVFDSEGTALIVLPTNCLFYLGRSKVTHNLIQEYVNKDYLRPLTPSSFRPPGDEVIPKPKPYEAVVFRDYFVAGLDFPLENFASEVLQRFKIQLHQLTPNAFARLSVFAMAMKMLGHAPNTDTFIRFYETQRKRSEVWDPIVEKKLPLEFGAFNFVPKKTRNTITIVPTYRNKWPQWTKYWFYH